MDGPSVMIRWTRIASLLAFIHLLLAAGVWHCFCFGTDEGFIVGESLLSVLILGGAFAFVPCILALVGLWTQLVLANQGKLIHSKATEIGFNGLVPCCWWFLHVPD